MTRGVCADPIKDLERRRKQAAAIIGKPRPESTRKKIAKTQTGKHHTIETRQKLSELNSGEKNPRFGNPLPQSTRDKIRKSRLGKYCGAQASAWKGGISFEPYCPKFTREFKERVRVFFGYRCMMPGCNHTWQNGEPKLAVHHVNFRKDSCCAEDVIPLFVPLCPGGCHSKTNFNRDYWEQLFTAIINDQYGGKCYLPKEG
jgi:hypothetical protein